MRSTDTRLVQTIRQREMALPQRPATQEMQRSNRSKASKREKSAGNNRLLLLGSCGFYVVFVFSSQNDLQNKCCLKHVNRQPLLLSVLLMRISVILPTSTDMKSSTDQSLLEQTLLPDCCRCRRWRSFRSKSSKPSVFQLSHLCDICNFYSAM